MQGFVNLAADFAAAIAWLIPAICYLGGGTLLIGSIYGFWQTVRFRHRALIVLSVITIACGSSLIVLVRYDGPDLPIVDYGMGIAFAIYIIANVFIPAWWFAKGRRRYRSRALGTNELQP